MDQINDELYQWIYNNVEGYGEAEKNHCPGTRVFPFYKNWLLKKPIMDLGSGTGQTVEFFRNSKYDAYGIDYIEPRNEFCRKGDISLSMDLKKYKVITCFDVIEHLSNAQVTGLFTNMVHAEHQIFTIANTPSTITKDGKKIDLHINKKSFPIWRGIIQDFFDIYYEFEIRDYQRLYLCKRKEGIQVLIDYVESQGYIVRPQDNV